MSLLEQISSGLRRMGHGTCKLCGKRATESRINSDAHMKQVKLTAAISWMHGGVPFFFEGPSYWRPIVLHFGTVTVQGMVGRAC